MKKRILLVAIAAAMSLSLIACGSKVDENALKDGKYELSTDADDKGNTVEFVMEVKDGKIASADYNEFSKGTNKRDVEGYAEKAGMDHAVVDVALTDALIEKQATDGIEAISGATSTVSKFTQIADQAIDLAKEGKTGAQTVELD